MTDVRYRWVIDSRGGRTRIDWKWLAATLVAGALTVILAIWLLPGGAAAVVLVALAIVAIAADVVIRRRRASP